MENGHILDGVDDDLGEKFISAAVASSTPQQPSIKENGGNSTATGFEI
jgi:hypothetical protein